MKSIKPGRGPSMMGGIMSIAMGIFGVIFTVLAASAGFAPMALFGVVFIMISIVQAIYNFKNATQKNRYSAFDITDSNEELDPFNERFGAKSSKFCPYCGKRVENDFEFCNGCGKRLP